MLQWERYYSLEAAGFSLKISDNWPKTRTWSNSLRWCMLFQAVVGNRELILRSSASLINERLPSLWVPSESCGGRDLESNCRSWLVNVTCFSDDSKNIEWFIKWKRIFISPNGIIDWLVYFMNQKLHCVEMGDQSVNLEIGLVDWMTSIQVK